MSITRERVVDGWMTRVVQDYQAAGLDFDQAFRAMLADLELHFPAVYRAVEAAARAWVPTAFK